MTNTKEKINWTGEIRELISTEALKRWPKRFATTRAVYYWLGSMNRIPLIPKSNKKVNALLVRMRQESDPKKSTRENLENGCIPWGYFPVNRGSNGTGASRWEDPEDHYNRYRDWFLTCDRFYEMPRWLDQDYHVEVWVEKLGLLEDIGDAVKGLDIQCRTVEGFPPWEFVYSNLDSIKHYLEDRATNASFVILYLGDLDPSGRDIPRQLVEALNFFGIDVDLKWVAMLPEQVKKYNIPELPTNDEVLKKIHNDSRYDGYMQWLSKQGVNGEMFAELDAVNAVNPDIIAKELRPRVEEYFDKTIVGDAEIEFNENMDKLQKLLLEARNKLK